MSASSKKKLRKEQVAEQLTERQRNEQAEAKKLKVLSITFIAIMAFILVVGLSVMTYKTIVRSGIAEKSTTVVTLGDQKLNTVEMSYYYLDTVNEMYYEWSESYGESMNVILQMMGLDLTAPLNEQAYPEDETMTWADYFVQVAAEKAQNDYALAAKANEAGFELPQTEKDAVAGTISTQNLYAQIYGYSSLDQYLQNMYCYGATEKSYTAYLERSALAEAYLAHYTEELNYEDTVLRAEDEKDPLRYNSYTYDSLYLSYTDYRDGEGAGENGAYTDEQNEAARAKVKEVAEQIKAAFAGAETLDAAIEAVLYPTEETTEEVTEETTEETTEEVTEETTEEATEETTEEATEETTEATTEETAEEVTEEEIIVEDFTEEEEAIEEEEKVVSEKNEKVIYNSINGKYSEWLADAARQAGDIELFENTATSTDADGNETSVVNGYYIVVFKSMTDNTEHMSDVRHLLVAFDESAEDAEADKNEAYAKAEELLNTWKENGATEEAFVELLKENTDDVDSYGEANNEGLYANIHSGSEYVENFLNWAIDGNREAGETAIVETEFGYHIMYYVGRSDLNYRDWLITQDLRAAELVEWQTEVLGGMPIAVVDTSKMKMDLTLG